MGRCRLEHAYIKFQGKHRVDLGKRLYAHIPYVCERIACYPHSRSLDYPGPVLVVDQHF